MDLSPSLLSPHTFDPPLPQPFADMEMLEQRTVFLFDLLFLALTHHGRRKQLICQEVVVPVLGLVIDKLKVALFGEVITLNKC